MAEKFGSILGQKGTSTDCKYYKRKLIGTGSYGEAWLAERVSDQAIFVAKTMDLGKMSARDKQYAYSEIKCLASCNHPNIIQYIEDHEENDQLLIVMEFADSGDLDRQIKARAADNFRYFQEHEALFLFLQLCLSLDHVHSHKMLHRDIKGANVLLTSTGLIKIGDFGFSHQYDDTVSGVVANTFCGTPYYLAPELWNNQRYSKKADVWSLGVLLYEILALKRPFTATNMKGLMAKVVSGDFPPLPEKYSQEFRDVVKFILVTDANQRPSVPQIFELPYIKEGLRVFVETVKKNTRISDSVKAALAEHVAQIQASKPAEGSSSTIGQINKDISYQGTVRKLGGVNGKSWKDRFLQLQRGHLIISEKEGEEADGKALSLEQVQSVCPVPASTAKRDFVFALNTTGGKSMWLQAMTQEEMEKWIHAIQQALGVA
jgi:serine/threonine protein kinase